MRFLIPSLLLIVGLSLGGLVGYLYSTQEIPSLLSPNPSVQTEAQKAVSTKTSKDSKRQVVGFLPYWLLSKATADYSQTVTTLTYFGLTLNGDGTIQEYTKKSEKEPGYYTLESGKLDTFLDTAKKNGQTLSLLVFASTQPTITELISDPTVHAQNLVTDIVPIMKQYGFTDLNVDIESVPESSSAAQLQFISFLTELRKGLRNNGINSLSIEVMASDIVRHRLISVPALKDLVDHVIVMAYDFHSTSSKVTGPVSPLSGGGNIYEYDVKTSIEEMTKVLPTSQIILGIPSYGYEWETLTDAPSVAIIPSTGLSASARRVDQLLQDCSTCTNLKDPTAGESYLSYLDTETMTYHQIFYPDEAATKAKVEFAVQANLGGMAVWALGYENDTLMQPLASYLKGSKK